MPKEATLSMEADIAFAVDEGAAKADQVDGVIGEGSMFQQTFGIYGQGVELSTATLPRGWRDRLVSLMAPDCAGNCAWRRLEDPTTLLTWSFSGYKPGRA